MDFAEYIDMIVGLNVQFDPEWELRLFQLGKTFTSDRGYTRAWRGDRYELLHRTVMNVPEGERVDHINGDPTDNRKCNLRVVTSSENSQNSKRPHNNKSGTKGVSQDPISGLWASKIEINGRRYRKKFKSLEDAIAHRRGLEAILFNRHSRKDH